MRIKRREGHRRFEQTKEEEEESILGEEDGKKE